jgi:hypothetical protein
MTKIRPVFFYYTDHQEPYRAVTKLIPHAEHVDTGQSSYAYWDELEARWDGSSDLLLIEQHVVIHDQVLPQLEACPNDWCTFPQASNGLAFWLGCTRFSARLQQAAPAAEIRKRARRKCPHCGAPHHAFIDGPIWDTIMPLGFAAPCVHQPAVEHIPE